MTRLVLIVLAALAAAHFVALELGGRVGEGVRLGFALGIGLSGLSVLYTRHVARTRPARALHASILGFLIKLAALLCGGLAFRFLEPAAERADHRAFLVSFAAAVALVLPLGTWIVLAEGRRRIPPARTA